MRNKLQDYFFELFKASSAPTNPFTGKSNKLRLFGKLKTDKGLSPYLQFVTHRKHKQALSKLRLSAHPLMIEVGRYSNISENERYCPFCNGLPENETHFLLHCNAYKNERLEFNKVMSTQFPIYSEMDDSEKTYTILNPIKSLANTAGKFIAKLLQIRKSRLSNQACV